jgi:hypothetical protein
MSPSGITVTVEGLDALKRKLGGATEPIGGIVREAGIFAREKTAQYAKPHAADKGTLGAGITLKLGAGAVPLEATIAPNSRIAGIAATVEEGRPPGKRPSVDRIERWAWAHGYLPRGSRGWKLAQQIAQRGTKGVKMFEHAAKDTEGKLKELIGKAAREIETRFGK